MLFKEGLFKDYVVVVAGATSGIGRSIAEAFATHDAKVYALGRNLSKLDDLDIALQIEKVKVDVSNEAEVNAFFNKLDQVDVLVNCAGFALGPAELTPEGFRTVIETNLHGSMITSYAAHEKMLASENPSIINTSSMLATFGSDVGPAYSSSKGAIDQLTKSLAIAYGREGIRVNAVAPGWIKTNLLDAAVGDPAVRDGILARTPLNRFGETKEIANAVLFLASPAASFVSGAILPIDGGYLTV